MENFINRFPEKFLEYHLNFCKDSWEKHENEKFPIIYEEISEFLKESEYKFQKVSLEENREKFLGIHMAEYPKALLKESLTKLLLEWNKKSLNYIRRNSWRHSLRIPDTIFAGNEGEVKKKSSNFVLHKRNFCSYFLRRNFHKLHPGASAKCNNSYINFRRVIQKWRN